MRILVLGATGRTGRQVVVQALVRGHEVTSLVRSASSVTAFTSIVADATKPDEIGRVMPDHDVVISCLGQRTKSDKGVLQQSAQAVLDAMKLTGKKPFLVVSQGLLFPARTPIVFLLRWILARHVGDSEAMEAAIRSTDVDWTIVRPPRLLDGGRPRGYHVADGVRPSGPASMQRADLAAFLLDEAETPRHSREVVGITSAK